ncbi:DltD [Kosakonia radicincitans DSM 16656]|uniref:D-alanyl-lipoteichoic acid biosynthesis protein DltD n=1 Tax=Kosakonia radicincitans TaxID=283686 RepID=UPI0002730175|nr:D-alanyl-lipoteichoic acid biosynthesis protein DltD [Kosakonia radicincitans]ARD61243.1 DltD [Kosakonia radicincitans DSM 16656]
MKIKNTFCLHILMALLAVLFLCIHPLMNSYAPPLKFQPLIESMDGTTKEQAEKIATISHALQGNAIFFIGASEVATSEDEPYAVYNYLNNDLHRNVVAFGDSFDDSITHFLLLSRFKDSLNANSKVVLLLAPDSFYSTGVPPTIFANNFPAPVFNPLMQDEQTRPFLVNYLRKIDKKETSHLTFAQMKISGWDLDNIWQEVSYEFDNFCTLIKNDWLAMLHIVPSPARPWPVQPAVAITPDWDRELAHARKLNEARQESADTLWMDKTVYEPGEKPEVWDDSPVEPEQMKAFRAMIQLLKEHHVQVVVIIDAINRRAVQNPELVQPAVIQTTAILKENQIPYLDMYSMPYQNGWNWDRLHPTDLAWVPMDRFIVESFK